MTVEQICEAELFITLEELARELRKVFKFKYLTVQYTYFVFPEIMLWDADNKPFFYKRVWETEYGDGMICDFLSKDIAKKLDLSEYADENGTIDFSKCIVEVE